MEMLLLALCLAPVVFCVVNTQGSVSPSAPGGFGVAIGSSSVDQNTDLEEDWIKTEGNEVRGNLADPLNAGPSDATNGRAWDDYEIFVDYDNRQEIRIGIDGYGIVETNGGSALRPMGMTLGEGGHGNLTVTGVGSVLNLDPERVPWEFQTAIAFAREKAGGSGVIDRATITYADVPDANQDTWVGYGTATSTGSYHRHAGDGSSEPTKPTGFVRRRNGTTVAHIPMVVGQSQASEAKALAGGRIEVGDYLTIDNGSLVLVDGSGSLLSISHTANSTQSEVKSGSVLQLSGGGSLSVATMPLKLSGLMLVGAKGSGGVHQVAGNLELNREGVAVRVRCGQTLVVDGDITGDGIILIDQGAEFEPGGSVSAEVQTAEALPVSLDSGLPNRELANVGG